MTMGDLLRLIRMTVEIGDQVRRSDYPWVHLEVGAVEMASLDSVKEIGELIEGLRASPGSHPQSTATVPTGAEPVKRTATKSPTRKAPATTSDTSRRRRPSARSGAAPAESTVAVGTLTATQTESLPMPEVWESVLEKIKAEKPLLWSILSQGDPGPVEGETFTFRIDPANGFHLEQLREPAHVEMIEARISEVIGQALHFKVRHEAGAGVAEAGNNSRPKVAEDPFVKKVLELLDGEIVG
jgi:hypothetical protein